MLRDGFGRPVPGQPDNLLHSMNLEVYHGEKVDAGRYLPEILYVWGRKPVQYARACAIREGLYRARTNQWW